MGTTAANKNRKIRQEALRDQLSAQGHVQHVNDIANDLLDLDTTMDQLAVQRLKAAADIKKSLISKYLPDLKSTEITGPDGDILTVQTQVTFVGVGSK